MKKGLSKYALLLFIAGVVLKCVNLLVTDLAVIDALFYVSIVAGLVLLSIETLSNKEFANAFCYDNKFHIDLFSYIAGVGFFVDFVSGVFQIYNLTNTFKYNSIVQLVPMIIQCVLAILSAVSMVAVGLSFAKDSSYDFKGLKGFNVVLLLWFVFKGINLLADNLNVDNILAFAVLILGILVFYFFLREIENNNGSSPYTVLCLRLFSYLSVMAFMVNLMLVLKGDLKVISTEFANSVTYLFVGGFIYFFEKNILAHSLIE